MNYFSLNKSSPKASFKQAVVNGIALDRGLYYPESITPISQDFIDHISEYSNEEVAFEVASADSFVEAAPEKASVDSAVEAAPEDLSVGPSLEVAIEEASVDPSLEAANEEAAVDPSE